MKIIYALVWVALAGVFTGMSVYTPSTLAQNKFICDFVSHDLLEMMSVMMTITIASIATIHIWFNELEDKHKKKVFGASRNEINQAASLLIWLFVGELALLIVRSAVDQTPTRLSFFNGGALLLFFAGIITLVDILGVVRALTPSD